MSSGVAVFGILRPMDELSRRLRAVKGRTWALLLAAAAVCGLAVLLVSSRKSITVIVDGGQEMQVTTYASRVPTALRSAGIDLQPADDVWPAPGQRIADGDVIRLTRAYWVSLQDGEQRLQVATTAESAAGVLSDAGWPLSPGDRVWVDGTLLASPDGHLDRHPTQMRLERAVAFQLQVDGRPKVFRSAAPTVAEALWENGINLYQGDVMEPPPQSEPTPGGQVLLTRSSPLTVAVGSERYRARVVAQRVGDALLEMDIPLAGLDYTRPSLGAPIPTGRRIEIVHKTEQVLIEQEPLPFDTEFQADPELEIDNQRLLSPGAYGIRARQLRVRFENGEEVGRVQDQEWVAREADPRLVGYGTHVVVRTKGTPDGTIKYWRAVVMHATSYSPCRVGADTCSNTTATGDRLKKGVAAVSVRWFPYMVGARVYVPGYGFATILDNGGGGPWARWIDLGYSDSNYEPWSQDVTVYFLTPVPGNILYILN